MAQSKDLGQKFTCFKCECKFYDLGAPEPICPRCGADQRENPDLGVEAPVPKKRGRKPAKAAAKKPDAKPVLEADDDGDDLLDDDFDDTPLEKGLKDAVADRMPEDAEAEPAPAKAKASKKKKTK